jgi:hypothetical protein
MHYSVAGGPEAACSADNMAGIRTYWKRAQNEQGKYIFHRREYIHNKYTDSIELIIVHNL